MHSELISFLAGWWGGTITTVLVAYVIDRTFNA